MLNYSDILESTFDKKCNVYTYKSIIENGIMLGQEKVLQYENIPCAISYKSLNTSLNDNIKSNVVQVIKLFISNKYKISPNSTIEINKTFYINSGMSAIYDTHQEIILKLQEVA